MKNNYYIYFHINPLTNKIFYVGKGKGKRAYWKYDRNKHWQNIANKYGFIVDIIEDGLTEEEAFQREIFYIQKIGKNKLCNYTDGGEGSSGVIHSEETRKKISKAHKGRTSPRKGCKFTEEQLKNHSEARKGKKHTEETRKKMSEGHKGKKREKFSEETIKRMSEARKGKKHSEETKQKIGQFHKGRIISEETRKKISETHKKRLSNII